MGRCMGGDGVWWGGEECMWVLPGLLMLDLGLGEGLDGDGEEVIGVVSGCEMHHPCTDPCSAQLAHQPKHKSGPT